MLSVLITAQVPVLVPVLDSVLFPLSDHSSGPVLFPVSDHHFGPVSDHPSGPVLASVPNLACIIPTVVSVPILYPIPALASSSLPISVPIPTFIHPYLCFNSWLYLCVYLCWGVTCAPVQSWSEACLGCRLRQGSPSAG